MLNLFQHPSRLPAWMVQVEKWTLKQVQGDVDERVIPAISFMFVNNPFSKNFARMNASFRLRQFVTL
jgi:hypothetical protein